MNSERFSLNGAFKISFLLHVIVCAILGLAIEVWIPPVKEERLIEVAWVEPPVEESETLPQTARLPEDMKTQDFSPNTVARLPVRQVMVAPPSSSAAEVSRASEGMPSTSVTEGFGNVQRDNGGTLGAGVVSSAQEVPSGGNSIESAAVGISASKRAAAIEAFLTRVEQRKKYPYIAMKRHLEGRPVIHVELDAAGNLVSLFVNSSSGVESLDQAALEAVKKACPYTHQLGVELTMDIPVRYELSEG